MSGCSWHRNVILLTYLFMSHFTGFWGFPAEPSSATELLSSADPVMFLEPGFVFKDQGKLFFQVLYSKTKENYFPGFVFKDQGKLFFQVFLHAGLDWAVYTPGQPVKVWPFKWKICETQLTCFGLQGNCSCRNLQFPSCFPSGPEIKANTLNHFCSKLIQKCFSSFRFNQMLLRSQ